MYTDTLGGVKRLWIKERSQARAAPLIRTSQAPPGPFFSPDGAWVAYGDQQLMKVPRSGGTAVVLSDSSAGWDGGAWLDDGSIVFPASNFEPLYRTSGRPARSDRTAALPPVSRH